MPDGTPTPEIQPVTNLESLKIHNPDRTPNANMSPDEKALIEQYERSSSPTDLLTKFANGEIPPAFIPDAEVKNMGLSFGAGNTERDKATEKNKFNGDIHSPEGKLFTEADGALKKLEDFQTYASLLDEAQRSGISVDQLRIDKGIDRTVFNNIREAALKSVEIDFLYQAIPELRGLGPRTVKDMLDLHLAKDPAFRQEITRGLSKVKLPTTEVTPNLLIDQLGIKLTELDGNAKVALDSIEAHLKSLLPDFSKEGVANPDLKALIEGYAKRGLDTKSILAELRTDLLPTGYFKKLTTEYRPHITEKQRIDKLADDLRRTQPNTALYNETRSEYLKAKGKWDQDETDWKTNDPKYQEFLNITSDLTIQNDSEITTNRAANRIQELVNIQKQTNEVTTQKSTVENAHDQATAASREARMAEEKAAIEQLRKVIPEAIAITLLERQQKATGIRTEQERAKFDAETNTMIDKLRTAQRTRGRGIVTDENGRGKRINDRDTIIPDARKVALQGEVGLQNVAVEMLGIQALDEHGQPQLDAQGNPVIKKEYSQLTPQEKAVFDKAYPAEKAAIKLKIATDLVASQSGWSKAGEFLKLGIGDRNGLNDEEWEGFGKFYKTDLKNIVSTSPEGQRVIAEMEKMGIKPDSKKGIKILGLLTLLLMAGLGFGAIAALAPTLAVGASATSSIATSIGMPVASPGIAIGQAIRGG